MGCFCVLAVAQHGGTSCHLGRVARWRKTRRKSPPRSERGVNKADEQEGPTEVQQGSAVDW